jgi:hypothetical protein
MIKTNELNASFLNFLKKVVQDKNEADAVAGLLAMQVGAPIPKDGESEIGRARGAVGQIRQWPCACQYKRARGWGEWRPLGGSKASSY